MEKKQSLIRFILLTALNGFYFIYLLILSIIYECFFLFLIFPFLIVLKKGRIDDVMRIHNWAFGRFVVRCSWPLVRIRLKGTENFPKKQPVVFVFNHRSYVDILFTTFVNIPNLMVMVRSWPFKLKLFKLYMLGAKYIDIEKISSEGLSSAGREMTARKVSFVFFPEGHRSRDGKILQFRLGAFMVAAENNLPIVPVCITGTEKVATKSFPYFHPARVDINILPSVEPGIFQGERQVRNMCKHVENMYKQSLGQEIED